MDNQTYEGEIIFYSIVRGFGFIKFGGSEDDIFMHATSLVNGFVPGIGEKVSFTIGLHKGRAIAKNVTQLA